MKSSVDQLTPGNKKALALFYDTEAFKALKTLANIEIDSLGKDALVSQSHEQTRYLAGRASMAKDFVKLIEAAYKDSTKEG